MASIQQDPSGNFHVTFRFGGQRFKRSLRTKLKRKAEAAASHIEENIRLINDGRMELPEDADIPTFLMSDGRRIEKPKIARSVPLNQLLERFEAEVPEGVYEETTRKTTRIHVAHFCRVLGGATSLRSLKPRICSNTSQQDQKKPVAGENRNCEHDSKRDRHVGHSLELGRNERVRFRELPSESADVSKAR